MKIRAAMLALSLALWFGLTGLAAQNQGLCSAAIVAVLWGVPVVGCIVNFAMEDGDK